MSDVTPAKPIAPAAPRPSGRWIALAAVLLSVAAFFAVARFGRQGDPELNQRVSRLSRVVWVGGERPRMSMPKELVNASEVVELTRALAAIEPARLTEWLASHGIDGVLAEWDPRAPAATVGSALHRFAHVRGLRGDYLTPRMALYLPDPLQQLSPTLQSALATVARGVLSGQRAPRVTSFPEALRRVQNVEVMVLVRREGRALLWRSARGSSIARALLMASQMARRRWAEREQALGGSLDKQLSSLEVEVALLHEDGTLGDRDPAFIDRVFGKSHGVAYERRGGWHYTLPEATQRDGEGQASRAYAKLLSDNGLPASSLEREDVRLYRLALTTLAVSPPTDTAEDDPARVATPDDVLGSTGP